MKQLRRRILGFFILIFIIFSIIFLFAFRDNVRDQSIQQQKDTTQAQLLTLISQITRQGQEDTSIINQLGMASDYIEERITLIDVNGEVIYDSHFDVSELENHGNRSEVQAALDEESTSTSFRASTTAETDLIYAASPIYNSNDSLIGVLRFSKNLNEINTLTNEIARFLLFFIIISFALTLIFTQYWTKKTSRPIEQIRKVTNRLSQQDYDARYTSKSYTEIDDLGSTVNHLAENLNQQTYEIMQNDKRINELLQNLIIGVLLINENREINIVNPRVNEILGVDLYGNVGRDYNELIQSADLVRLIERAIRKGKTQNAELTLYLQNERIVDVNVVPITGRNSEQSNYLILLYDITEIRRLEKVRTDFVANASHELRTPITALKGFSETLLDGAMDDREVLVEFLNIMHKESTRLDSMVQDILQLSKLEQKPAPDASERIEVRPVIEEVVQILNQKADLKNIQCSILGSEKVQATVNQDEFKQVMLNLVGNAISYTSEGGEVKVHLSESEREAVIQVEDNGIGIPKEDQTRIFERFYRVDKARSRNAGGTGLGLSIVKWMIEGMDGRIELKSEVNKGSIFTIYLPN